MHNLGVSLIFVYNAEHIQENVEFFEKELRTLILKETYSLSD